MKRSFQLIFLLAAFSSISIISATLEAKQVATPYLNFQISDRWVCQRADPLAFTCQLQSNQPVRDALIIISAKEAGPEDNFASFQKYLAMPKPLPVMGGRAIVSKPQYVKQLVINRQTWVDGVQFNGEIAGYYTRYLTTVKQNLSILITFSAARERWRFFSQDFNMAVQTLQLTKNPAILAQPFTLGQKQNVEGRGHAPSPNNGRLEEVRSLASATGKNSSSPNYIIMGLVGLLVMGLLVYAIKS